MNEKLKAGIKGGLLMGALSAIPYVNLANSCCIWVMLGSGLASYLYIRKSVTPVLMAEGLQVGGVAGIVGGLIYFLIGLPLNILARNPSVGLIFRMIRPLSPEQADNSLRQYELMNSMPFMQQYLRALPGGLISLAMFVLLGALGGLLGVVAFERRKSVEEGPPPPPQDFPSPPPITGTQPGAARQAE
jgi:hypothetical protein